MQAIAQIISKILGLVDKFVPAANTKKQRKALDDYVKHKKKVRDSNIKPPDFDL